MTIENSQQKNIVNAEKQTAGMLEVQTKWLTQFFHTLVGLPNQPTIPTKQPVFTSDSLEIIKFLTNHEAPQLSYRHILWNLDENLVLFAENFMSKRLRREMRDMLDNAGDKTPLHTIFFFGTYPLEERYLTYTFSKEAYTEEGRDQLRSDFAAYVRTLRKKTQQLQELSHILSHSEAEPLERKRAIARIAATISVLEKSIPMVAKLYNGCMKLNLQWSVKAFSSKKI